MKASIVPKNIAFSSILILLFVLVFVGLIGYFLEFSLPTRPPKLDSTYTPLTQTTPQEIGSYDVLGSTVSKTEADRLLQTESESVVLNPENGAVAITENLINLGRDAFYRETFGNEYFFTDIVGAINGPINLVSMGKAIAALKGQPTTNLQITLDQDVTVPTNASNAAPYLLNIDKETYLGVPLQNAANPKFRLPEGVKPSVFFEKNDPTPGEPGINEVIKMPGFPFGSIFILDGLMASSPGLPVGAQVNGISAYQNTLAPPPVETRSLESLQRGADVFKKASCVECHSGRYFTNHEVIPAQEVKSQPSRASALAKFPQIFVSPKTYPNNISVPLPTDPPVISVPLDITPQRIRDLAYAVGNSAGGYKVQHLIGLYFTAPYLHDGGVAASSEALRQESDGSYAIADREQMGLAGTLLRNLEPDPEASLRVLVDRNLRQTAVAVNRENADLQATNIDGSGHEYWVDKQAGFTPQDQTNLIQFLLSIDDNPAVLPNSVATKSQ